MIVDPHEPAYPTKVTPHNPEAKGMSTRTYMANRFLWAMLNENKRIRHFDATLIPVALQYADALIAELNKGGTQ